MLLLWLTPHLPYLAYKQMLKSEMEIEREREIGRRVQDGDEEITNSSCTKFNKVVGVLFKNEIRLATNAFWQPKLYFVT